MGEPGNKPWPWLKYVVWGGIFALLVLLIGGPILLACLYLA